MSLLGWNDKLPVIRWLLDSSDEAIAAVGLLQVILSDTDELTERKAIHDLVDVLHPVYWRHPFQPDTEIVSFSSVGGDVSLAEVSALLPQAPDGSRLKKAIDFLIEHSDEAIKIILTLLALFGAKK